MFLPIAQSRKFTDLVKAKRKASEFDDAKYDILDDYHSHPQIQYVGKVKGRKVHVWPELSNVYSEKLVL